jgi:general secretion pathway protein K
MNFILNETRRIPDLRARHKNSRGSILIVCFFVLVLITLFAITVGYTMRQKLQVMSRLDNRQKLRLIGDAGVQKAIYVLLKNRERASSYDALNQGWNRNEAEFEDIEVGAGIFSVFYSIRRPRGGPLPMEEDKQYGLVDEERKIPVNLVLKSPAVLRRLFNEVGGMNEAGAAGLVDAIRDWIDEDEDTSLTGAESRYYKGLNPPYMPRNGKIATLSELQWVKGMKPEIYEKILPFITIDSSGQVNLNTASKPVLVALGISSDLCKKIMDYRKGRDQLEGTPDDQAFEDLSSVAQQLANRGYLNDNERANLNAVIQSGLLTVKSRFFTAQVLARLKYKNQSLRIAAVFDEKGAVKRWEEAFAVS